MEKKVYLSCKQQKQIIDFFENSFNKPFCFPSKTDDLVISLFRCCRSYLETLTMYPALDKEQKKEKALKELSDKLDILHLRHYVKI